MNLIGFSPKTRDLRDLITGVVKLETSPRQWLGRQLAEQCVKQLRKHGFDSHLADNVKDASSLILEMTADCESFGFGGSETTRILGVIPELKNNGKTVYDHWRPGLSAEEDRELRLLQGRADCFLCGANAISAGGEIVNVDGVGNRTNAMSFGCGKVIIVAGVNKITHDLPSALRRVKEVAAPMRAKSLSMNTPCAKTGFCADCDSPQRICRITTILHRQPMQTKVSAVLINQDLGF